MFNLILMMQAKDRKAFTDLNLNIFFTIRSNKGETLKKDLYKTHFGH